MFNSYTIKIYTFSQKLIDDKIFAKATTPESYAKIETKSKCPMSKFAKYMPFLTLKHCSGISSFYNRSLLMKSWVDYYASTLNGKSFSLSADKKYTVRDHPKEQFSPMFGDKVALKLMSPFIIEAPKDLMFLVSEAVYHYEDNREYKNIKCLQGVVAGTNQSNVIFLMPKDEEAFIKYKSPLVYFTPLSNKKFNIEYKLISYKEYEDMLDLSLNHLMVGETKGIING